MASSAASSSAATASSPQKRKRSNKEIKEALAVEMLLDINEQAQKIMKAKYEAMKAMEAAIGKGTKNKLYTYKQVTWVEGQLTKRAAVVHELEQLEKDPSANLARKKFLRKQLRGPLSYATLERDSVSPEVFPGKAAVPVHRDTIRGWFDKAKATGCDIPTVMSHGNRYAAQYTACTVLWHSCLCYLCLCGHVACACVFTVM